MRRRFTAEMVQDMHRVYLVSDKPAIELAREFGIRGNSQMYNLFTRFGLTARRPERQIDPALVRQVHMEYLTTELTVREFAAEYGISSQQMFLWFKALELPLKGRNQLRKPKVMLRTPRLCPAARTHEACAECPCPVPMCKPGRDWHCGVCAGNKQCACCNAALREEFGFGEWYARWKAERKGNEEQWRRVQALLREGARRCSEMAYRW